MPAPILTPDGRYIVVEGKTGPRLWRAANPHLPEAQRVERVWELMAARRAVRDARGDPVLLREARAQVDRVKRLLGERGPVWWDDASPDLNRTLVRNSPYAAWWQALGESERLPD
jgi:hypothetical protein